MGLPGRRRKRRLRRGILSGFLLALVGLLSLPMSALPAFASPAVTQSGGSHCSGCTTLLVATTSAIAVGDVLVVSVQAFNTGSTVCPTPSAFGDSESNAWTSQATLLIPASGLNECVFTTIFTAPITAGGATDTISVTMSGLATWIGIQYQELSGVSTSGIVTSGGSAQQTSCAVPTLFSYALTSEPFSPGSILVGSYSTDYILLYGAPTAGSTFTIQADGGLYEAFDEYSTTTTSPNTWPAGNLGGVCLWAGVGVALPATPSQVQVPQFPLGLSLLLALALPAMILLRSRVFSATRP